MSNVELTTWCGLCPLRSRTITDESLQVPHQRVLCPPLLCVAGLVAHRGIAACNVLLERVATESDKRVKYQPNIKVIVSNCCITNDVLGGPSHRNAL